ncbi:MAG: PHP domain-containing protein [Methylococcaceae bacterium]|jgi:3',5'-nucleoside bisphosphate phosphatase|nr:PHP domain-containing protein [Methylococcaceae bacterium]
MTFKIDLHCHSNFSDGALSPKDLITRAQSQQVSHLALTDHDTTAGLTEAGIYAKTSHLTLINGIELSTTWNNRCFHIVGINIDPDACALQSGTLLLGQTRLERAEKIALKLTKRGIPGAMDYVLKKAGHGMITRSHFAQFLLEENHVSSFQNAFDKYLGAGKSAFVSTSWVELETAVNWITDSGGHAIIAHPLRYKLTNSWLKRFLTAFKLAGGVGIEVVTGHNNPDDIRKAGQFALTFDLYGSVGSDFHSDKNKWVELGRLAPLPRDIKPIWDLF